MAYDPGALNASLAAAVGQDGDLMAELRAAFIESAGRQLDLMSRARCDANWTIAASRLKSLGASFGATLKDPSTPTKEAVIHVYPRRNMIGRAVRTARHRLV